MKTAGFHSRIIFTEDGATAAHASVWKLTPAVVTDFMLLAYTRPLFFSPAKIHAFSLLRRR